MRLSNFHQVAYWHSCFNVNKQNTPTFPDKEHLKVQVGLIAEEFTELLEAIEQKDFIAYVDAICDMLFVIYGLADISGLPMLNDCFDEITRSNMSKLGPTGKPLFREDGKILKGPEYSPPNLKPIIYKEIENATCSKESTTNGADEIGQ
jgi:predicted HAD superfamily Cof-like phosphohydrolase